jgi:hypothetical protein
MVEVVEETRTGEFGGPTLLVRPRMSWGAIFGGVVTALGLWLLLYVFGLAVGLSTIDTRNPALIKPIGIFTGIWAIITPLIALFVGGYVAGRGAGQPGRFEGAMHGLVVWGLATIAGAYVGMMTLTAIMGSVASVGHGPALGPADGAATVEAAGRAFWGIFGALLLGLIAALGGGASGTPGGGGGGGRRERVRAPVRRVAPVAPPREVYP